MIFKFSRNGRSDESEASNPQLTAGLVASRNTGLCVAAGFVFLLFAVLCSHASADETEEMAELGDRISEATQTQQRHQRLADLTTQKLRLLRELKRRHQSLIMAETVIENGDSNDQQVEQSERSLHESEVGIEIANLQLEVLDRRIDLEELTFEFGHDRTELTKETRSLTKILDAAGELTQKFGKALLAGDDEMTEELELEFQQTEREFERRREALQLRVELIHAREEGEEEWIRELENELEQMDAAERAEKGLTVATADFPSPIELTDAEIQSAASLDFAADILPRFKAACFDCHAQNSASGDLDLETLVNQQPLVVNRSHWLNVVEQIRVRSMPPADAEQLSDEDRRVMLGWLTDALENFDYTTVRRVASAPAKRLTHDEYNNTVRDLVGIDLRPADRFPADLTASNGFENSANSLFMQPVMMERYVGAAEAIASQVVDETTSREVKPEPTALAAGPFQGLGAASATGDVKQRIRQFASRAYRRPVEKDELAALMKHYTNRRSRGDSVASALRNVLQVILISPNFLIRSESAITDAENAVLVSDWEMASRLSYFLWASMPDDELFDLAESGRLNEPSVLRRQVERMLDDPRSETLGSLFAAQWLGFAQLDRVQRDQIDNPWATDSLVAAMKAESAMLFHWLVRQNASVDRLLDADYTFVNDELANHYGIEQVEGSRLQKVSLQGTSRRGILGHASILATTSFPHRTSPVMRGNWVLTTLLGTPPPPPPPNVSEFNDRVADNDRLSQRQKLELHRNNPRCYACHSQIDPLGFAMEEFEWFGRYRPHRDGHPVDSVGKLPDGTKFRGLEGLSATLLEKRSDDLAKQLTRKLLAYALGRQLEYYDEATVRELTSQLEADNRRVRTLIHAIVVSETFRMKR